MAELLDRDHFVDDPLDRIDELERRLEDQERMGATITTVVDAVPQATTEVQGKVELATDTETEGGTDTERAVTPAGLRADVPDAPAADRGVRLDGDGNYIGPDEGLVVLNGAADDNIWRLGETVLDLDFTGTDYDTKAECQALGVKFSDDDTLPDTLVFGVSGSWTHSAGNGWQPASSAGDEGPALLVPLARPGNWELEVGFSYTPGDVDEMGYLSVGYIANSNHVGAYGQAVDLWVAASDILWRLATNDGDDTFTVQYLGSVLSSPSGSYVIRFRCLDGCVYVYDDEDDAWHSYTGRQSAGIAFTAAHAFVQVARYSNLARPLFNIYLESLTLTYLL